MQEARLDRQLERGEAHRLLRGLARHAGHLEEHASGKHDGDPALGLALAASHPGLGRLLRERVIGKDADPDLAAALDVPGHGAPGCLDLTVGHPALLGGLEPVRAEIELVATLRGTGPPSAMELAMLGSLRHQHRYSSSSSTTSTGPSAFLTSFFGARETEAGFLAATGLRRAGARLGVSFSTFSPPAAGSTPAAAMTSSSSSISTTSSVATSSISMSGLERPR